MPEIDVAFNQKFYRDYILLSQQKVSRLEDKVRKDPENLDGKYGFFNRIGPTEMVERTSKHADTPIVGTDHSKRRVSMRAWEWADLLDHQDLAKVIANPQNAYVMNANMAARRKRDDMIIAAMRGSAYSIDVDDAATAVALPSAQKVPVATSGLTLAKLLVTKEIIDASEADEDDPRFMAVTTKQVTNMLNTTEIKSADYNTVKSLAEGKIDTFLGFTFVRTERLIKASTTRYCLAWVKSGVGLAIGEEIKTDIGFRKDKSNAVQILVDQQFGATRIEDSKVVEVACLEA
jgi:hypothetical protein